MLRLKEKCPANPSISMAKSIPFMFRSGLFKLNQTYIFVQPKIQHISILKIQHSSAKTSFKKIQNLIFTGFPHDFPRPKGPTGPTRACRTTTLPRTRRSRAATTVSPATKPRRARSELVTWVQRIQQWLKYTIWFFNIAMENPQNKWRFLAGKIIYFYGPSGYKLVYKPH